MKMPNRTKRIALCLAVMACVAFALLYFHQKKSRPEQPSIPIAAHAPSHYGIDLSDPQPSFGILRYVHENPADDITRSQAIVWLDEQARTGKPLPAHQESYLLALLEKGGNTDWHIEYKLWLFNSAFNALHHSLDPKPLSEILLQLAATHPHRTMRLYALQHIGMQRSADRLTGTLADQARDLLLRQSGEADTEVCGSAIHLLLTWNKEQTEAEPDLIARALEIVTSSARPIDARITALHAAERHALATARNIAADSSQPILFRKAAIALMGKHGSENDLAALQAFAEENFRLAQAADPARTAIEHRSKNPDRPQPLPF